jgi:hypothetical protein
MCNGNVIDKGFKDFLLWEATTRDTVDFKTAYVDIADDLLAGLLLSQIVYWYLPSKKGGSKLRVRKDGHYWIAKGRADWWDEIRLKPRQVDRATSILVAKGLIVTALYKFDGAPTTHLRLMQEAFMAAWQALIKAREPISPDGQMDFTDSLNPSSPDGEMDLPVSGKSLTETTSEITSETTTEIPAPIGAEPSLSPGELKIQELQNRFGADPLALLGHCADVQADAEVKDWTVPVEAGGGDDLGQAMLEQWCAAKRVAIDTLPGKLANDWRRWLRNLASKLPNTPREILIKAVGVVLNPDNSDFNYYRYNSPANKKFQADWQDVALELMSGGDGHGQERKAKGRRASRDGDWPGEDEQDAVWSVHGDWTIAFFEAKREEVVAEFGDDRYLNTGTYNSQIAQELGISSRQMQALIMAYERWHVARVPALDARTFLGEEA